MSIKVKSLGLVKNEEIEINIDGYPVKIIFAENTGQDESSSTAINIRKLILDTYIDQD